MNTKNSLNKQSGMIGVINALKAVFSFSFINLLFILTRNVQELDITSILVFGVSSIVLFLGVSVIAVPIGYLAGMSTFNNLSKGNDKAILDPNEIEKKGRVLGALLSALLCVFFSLIIFRRGDLIALFFYFISAVFFSSFFGGIAARQILMLILYRTNP
jgi:hypothetical protein